MEIPYNCYIIWQSEEHSDEEFGNGANPLPVEVYGTTSTALEAIRAYDYLVSQNTQQAQRYYYIVPSFKG